MSFTNAGTLFNPRPGVAYQVGPVTGVISLPDPKDLKPTSSDPVNSSREARLLAISCGAMALFTAGSILTIAYVVIGISTALLLTIGSSLLFPPPIAWGMGLIGGITAATAFAYYGIKVAALPYFEKAKEHWNLAETLSAENKV